MTLSTIPISGVSVTFRRPDFCWLYLGVAGEMNYGVDDGAGRGHRESVATSLSDKAVDQQRGATAGRELHKRGGATTITTRAKAAALSCRRARRHRSGHGPHARPRGGRRSTTTG